MILWYCECEGTEVTWRLLKPGTERIKNWENLGKLINWNVKLGTGENWGITRMMGMKTGGKLGHRKDLKLGKTGELQGLKVTENW